MGWPVDQLPTACTVVGSESHCVTTLCTHGPQLGTAVSYVLQANKPFLRTPLGAAARRAMRLTCPVTSGPAL